METERIPWLFAILTAGWFGWMAIRAGRKWVLWAVGGAAFGLVTSTIIIGLFRAGSTPFSEQERRMDQIKFIAAAVGLIAILGWMLTSSLHRHHLLIWRKFRPESGPPEPAPAPPKPPGTGTGKTASGKTQG